MSQIGAYDFAERADKLLQEVAMTGSPRLDLASDADRAIMQFGVATVAVLRKEAEAKRQQFQELLDGMPTESEWGPVPALKDGPSYIHLGGLFGSQGNALAFMAVCQHLGIAAIRSPADIGVKEGSEAYTRLAGQGMLYLVPKGS